MRAPSNHYEVMGLPENATAAQIKKKYRELVRQHHPDVAVNKAEAHRMFIRINEAYEILSDSTSRHIYDQGLEFDREKERRRQEQAAQQRRDRYQRTTQSVFSTSPEKKKMAQQHVRNAQVASIQHRYQQAINECNAALRVDSRNSQAHTILGDIYKNRGRIDLAVKHYSFAVQFSPADRDVERKLTELLSKQISDQEEVVEFSPGTVSFYQNRLNIVLWTLVVGLLIGVRLLPKQNFSWNLATAYMSYIWNWNVLLLLGFAAFIVGFAFAVNGWVSSPSRELLSGRAMKGGSIPLGMFLLAVSLMQFWLAAFIYFVAAYLRGELSKSIIRLMGAVIGLVFITAIVYGSGYERIIAFWCGNLAFPVSVLGWYSGHALNPMKRYGWSK